MYKQLIVIRKDLNLSPIEFALQVSRASAAFITRLILQNSNDLSYTWLPVFKPEASEKRVLYKHPLVGEQAEKAYKAGKNTFSILQGRQGIV